MRREPPGNETGVTRGQSMSRKVIGWKDAWTAYEQKGSCMVE